MIKSRAIVLHTLRYNDEQLIVDLLTEAEGFVTMMVRVSRSRRASVRHTLFQPLAVLQLEWEHRPKTTMQRPRSALTALPYTSLPYDADKATIALFLSEFLRYIIRREPEARLLFGYILDSLAWLDACRGDFANFHLVFLLRLSRFLGIMPNMDDARDGYCFDLRASVFTPTVPAHPDYLPPLEAQLVPKLMRMRYQTMHVFRFSGRERSQLLEHILRYYRLHLPDFPEVKSLGVLRDVYRA